MPVMERFHQIRRSWPVAVLCVFYIYLAFHALSGSQGLVSWAEYEADITRYERQLEEARSERTKLEARTDALRTSGLDIDALDLKAREQAFVAHPQEVTIWLGQKP